MEAMREPGLALFVAQLFDEHSPGGGDLRSPRASVRARKVARRSGANPDAGRVHVVVRPGAIAGLLAQLVDDLPVRRVVVVDVQLLVVKAAVGIANVHVIA